MAGAPNRPQNLRDAYSNAQPHVKAALDAILEEAHKQALEVLAGRRSAVEHPQLVVAWAMLNPGVAALETQLAHFGPNLRHVDRHGAIWGTGKYEQLDPGWSEALVEFIEYRDNKAAFRTTPVIIDVPDTTTLALAGDWGTGFWRVGTGAEGVAKHINANRPDYTVHLGDVYYAGKQAEEEEFVRLWPRGMRGSFTLNSNHEMYSGAHTFYDQALAPGGPFETQNRNSYFALRNRNWVLIGLDTAYYASPDKLYNEGAIDDAGQGAFLCRLGAEVAGRRVIILSHHEGFDLKGETLTPLWNQVTGALGRVPDYWYWGHAHNAVVYRAHDNDKGLCRCVGHGAIPYGPAADLAGAAHVDWSETKVAGDASLPERVLNGYARISLDGATLAEKLIGEDGSVRWSR